MKKEYEYEYQSDDESKLNISDPLKELLEDCLEDENVEENNVEENKVDESNEEVEEAINNSAILSANVITILNKCIEKNVYESMPQNLCDAVTEVLNAYKALEEAVGAEEFKDTSYVEDIFINKKNNKLNFKMAIIFFENLTEDIAYFYKYFALSSEEEIQENIKQSSKRKKLQQAKAA